jgi:trimeric autotransporter adhesin
MKRTALLFASSLSLALPLHAATATVTSNGDAGTASTCIAPVACSLRQAINRVNSNLLTDTIDFAIPGAGPHVIAPTTELPALVRTVFINGYSQSGAAVNTSTTGFNAVLKIQLSGTNMPTGSAGLRLQDATASSVQGLSITGFGVGGRAIEANGAGVVAISGCIIGLTPAFVAAGNFIGIQSLFNQTGAVRIGTLSNATPRAVNLISQNTNSAIELNSVPPSAQTGSSFVGHNLINVAADGVTFVGGFDSLIVARANLTIAGNVIGGGRSIQTGTGGFIITGNRINANLRPITLLGTFSAPELGTIGGLGALANLISNSNSSNLADPSLIAHSANLLSVDLSLNRMFVTGSGAPVGVDLGNNGITANDLGDPDTGPNGLQNFPILTSASRTSATGVVSLSGTLNSLPNRSFRLVFYANPNAVRAGQFFGDSSTDVSTDVNGNVSFGPLQLNFGNGATVVNHVSATATLIDNVSLLPFATSEFAASIPIQLVTPPATFTVTSVDDPGNGVCDSSCTLREAIVAANSTGSPTAIDEIRFNIPGAGPHTIILGSALPVLTQSVTIDGYTQPGAQVNTDATGVGTNAVLKIEIRAAPAATFSVFAGDIAASNVTLRGLSVNAFNTTNNLVFLNATNTRIEGCWFGVRPNGDEALTSFPLNFSSGSAFFGGASPAQRNIWNNARTLGFAFQTSSRVSNSLFGVMPSGRVAATVATSVSGFTSLDISGGSCENNVFATAATGRALSVNFTDVVDNAFGESFDGATVLTLGRAISNATNSRISSATHRIRNPQLDAIVTLGSMSLNQSIAGGAARGVVYNSPNEDAISFNSAISGTAGLGIDLGGDGVTLNDLGDLDVGLQNFPVLTSAVRNGTTISITGTLNSLPNQNFRILICGIAAEHVSMHGGCDEVLSDETIVSTDANGNAGFTVTVDNNPAYGFITATASRIVSATEEQTSEFALNIPITGFQEIIFANGFEGN